MPTQDSCADVEVCDVALVPDRTADEEGAMLCRGKSQLRLAMNPVHRMSSHWT